MLEIPKSVILLQVNTHANDFDIHVIWPDLQIYISIGT